MSALRWAGRTRVTLCAALVVMAMGIASCSGASGAAKPSGAAGGFKPGVLDRTYAGTTINVLVPAWAAQPAASIAKFTAATGIVVKQETLDFNAVHDKIVTSESAGQAPADVTEMDWTWVSQFGKAGWYADLKKYLPAETISGDVGNKIFLYKGQQVAVPYNLDFRGMVVDMTALGKAGVTTPPTTWAEVTAAAEAVRSQGGAQYPVALPLSVTEGSATPWYALTKAAGGEVLDASGQPAFSTSDSGGSKAVAFIKSLYDSKLIAPGSISLTDSDVTTQFLQGKAPIVLSVGPGLLSNAKNDDKSTVKADDVQFVAVPGSDAEASKLVGLQEGLGIPAKAAHPEAAAEFMYWWQQAEQQVTSYSDPNMGNVPSQQAALAMLVTEKKLIGGDQILKQSQKVGPVFAEAAPTWYSQFSTDVASMLHAVAAGQTSVDSGIKQLSSQTATLASGG